MTIATIVRAKHTRAYGSVSTKPARRTQERFTQLGRALQRRKGEEQVEGEREEEEDREDKDDLKQKTSCDWSQHTCHSQTLQVRHKRTT